MAEVKKTKAVVAFRELDITALQTKVAELRKELVEQQRAHKAGELPSPSIIGKTRKSIATALTVLQEKASQAPKEQEK